MIIFVIEVKAPFPPAEMNGNLTQIGLSRCIAQIEFGDVCMRDTLTVTQ